MNKNVAIIFTGVLGAAGAAFGAYNFYQNRKIIKERDDLIKTLSDKIDVSVETIKNNADFDISEKLIKAAVLQASREQVKEYAEHGAQDVRNEVVADIHNECWKAVQDLKDDVKPEVQKTLENKAKKVTIEDIKNAVIDKCTEDSKRYIRTEMDEITSQYKKQIDNLTQVYNNISTAIGKESK